MCIRDRHRTVSIEIGQRPDFPDDVASLCVLLNFGKSVSYQLRQAYQRLLRFSPPDSRKGQEIVNQIAHTLGRLQHHQDVVVTLFIQPGRCFLLKQLSIASHVAKGRTQVMRDGEMCIRDSLTAPAWDYGSAAPSLNRMVGAYGLPLTLPVARVLLSPYPPKSRAMNDNLPFPFVRPCSDGHVSSEVCHLRPQAGDRYREHALAERHRLLSVVENDTEFEIPAAGRRHFSKAP